MNESIKVTPTGNYFQKNYDVEGVERITGLQRLQIQDNQIVELNIRGLDKLQRLWVHNNKIRDMSAAEYLKAKGCCQGQYYIGGQNQPSQEEIDEARLW
ncbi:Leucine-rich_repeat domain superfamily [Hexamita inflata]|uniref:Leucine-rich repeat domain superfamily n=1 Tax=Hexamita inflata TaxID=28002 RepID=A0AA86R3E1_9EUKA|nr:Leucine-rich repeat domain superfamily [Hexamita inflata]CAI9968572.1 Leucine-rich repeat domain superfamily [Hexamita inflata]